MKRRATIAFRLAAVAASLLIASAVGVRAQDEPPVQPDPNAPRSSAQQREDRAERLRKHREEMMMRLEEGKKQREERRKEEAAAKASKMAEEVNRAREDQALRLAEKAQAEGKPIPEQALEVLAGRQNAQRQASYSNIEGVFYADPLSATIAEGERAAVEYHYYNKGDAAVTSVTVALEYPPWGVKPVAVYVDGLERGFRDARVSVHNDEERGLLTIHGESPRPAIFKTGSLATVVWEGIAPMRDTTIRYVFRGEMGTGARLGAEDKLGIPDSATDGVVAGNLRVAPAAEARLEVRKTRDGGIIAGLFDDWSVGEVALFLAPDHRVVRAGEEFSVAVCLLNPDSTAFEKLQLVLRFDPETLEAVDFDKGANIRQGINMDDGALAWRFALDHHFENQADNENGLFRYKAASANGDGNEQEGVIAVARFKAKKAAASTSIVFVHPAAENEKDGTRVVRLGEDILARDRLEEAAVVRVLPADPNAEPKDAATEGGEEGGATRFLSAAERKAARDKELAEWRENRAQPGQELVVTFGDLSFIGDDNPLQQAKKPGDAAKRPAAGATGDPGSKEVR